MNTGIIDRNVVREILREWLSPQTAGQLIALGYDRETVREIFQEEFTKWLESRKP